MKSFKKCLTTIAVASALSAAGSASAGILNNWYFNPAGSGLGSAQQINEYLDINGNAFIDINPTGGTGFSFTESGVFNSLQADSNGQAFAGGNITATFNASGSGTFGSGFTFAAGGLINVYSDAVNNYGSTTGIFGADDGTLIGAFSILAGGGGAVDASGNPTANGQITVFAQALAGALTPGYFFDPLGNDLSLGGILAFAFTNANTIGNPTATSVDEIICQGAGFAGAGCDGINPYANAPGNYIFVSNNGQFKLATVPEPGSLALLGVGLLGLFGLRRRGSQA